MAQAVTHPSNQMVNDLRLENIAERNPVQEAEQSLQSCLDETWLVGLFQYLIAEGEDVAELATHGLLEVLGLGLSHLVG